MNSITYFLRVAIVVLVSCLSGCAFGRTTSYLGASNFVVDVKSPKKTVVVMHDQRDYVLSNNKGSHFVGLMRSLMGIPYNLSTSTGNPLANDFGSLVRDTLLKNGLDVRQEIISPFQSRADFLSGNTMNVNERLVFITLSEWKTDLHVNGRLFYELNLEVYDASKKLLGSSTESGTKMLSGSYDLSTAVTEIFNNLFAKPQIKFAMT